MPGNAGDRSDALKVLIEALEAYRDEHIEQSEGDEGLSPIANSPVKSAVQRLQCIYGRGPKRKLPYPQSLWWRKVIRYTDPETPVQLASEERRVDFAEDYLNRLTEWAKGELRKRPAKRRGKAGRKPSAEIARRNKAAATMFKAGKSVNDVCQRFKISAVLARKIKSEASRTKPEL